MRHIKTYKEKFSEESAFKNMEPSVNPTHDKFKEIKKEHENKVGDIRVVINGFESTDEARKWISENLEIGIGPDKIDSNIYFDEHRMNFNLRKL